MNDLIPGTHMLIESKSENHQPRIADDEATLDERMTDLGLSDDTKRFLRNLHVAEKQLNDAFNKARQGGELGECVSEVYHNLYGAGCGLPTSR
jgi:hypothetical protein